MSIISCLEQVSRESNVSFFIAIVASGNFGLVVMPSVASSWKHGSHVEFYSCIIAVFLWFTYFT